MKELLRFDLVYLATPYSKFPGGIQAAFIDAACIAARLLRAGVKVYSPITHTHPIGRVGDHPAGFCPLNGVNRRNGPLRDIDICADPGTVRVTVGCLHGASIPI